MEKYKRRFFFFPETKDAKKIEAHIPFLKTKIEYFDHERWSLAHLFGHRMPLSVFSVISVVDRDRDRDRDRTC
jgi:hypothetical protein